MAGARRTAAQRRAAPALCDCLDRPAPTAGGGDGRSLLVQQPLRAAHRPREDPGGEPDPLGYWQVTLPSHTALEAVVNTAKGRWWIEQGYRDLKQEVGLGDFEGRGWRGFHHHVTLTLAAYGFLVMQRCEHGPPAGGRATNLSFPGVPDPANPPLRPERHVASSIATQRRRVIIALARRLPRCPCCHALPTPQFDRANPIRLVPQ